MSAPERYLLPLPMQHSEAKPFWDGLRNRVLMIQQCRRCSRFQFFPRDACRYCGATELEWQTASGRGTIYSISVVHRAVTEAFADHVPYVLALVELEEGVRLMTNIIDCEPDDLAIGQDVVIVYDDVASDVTLAKFRPGASTEAGA